MAYDIDNMPTKNAAILGRIFYNDTFISYYIVVVDDGPLSKPITSDIMANTIKIWINPPTE